MKITASQLKKIIVEELGKMATARAEQRPAELNDGNVQYVVQPISEKGQPVRTKMWAYDTQEDAVMAAEMVLDQGVWDSTTGEYGKFDVLFFGARVIEVRAGGTVRVVFKRTFTQHNPEAFRASRMAFGKKIKGRGPRPPSVDDGNVQYVVQPISEKGAAARTTMWCYDTQEEAEQAAEILLDTLRSDRASTPAYEWIANSGAQVCELAPDGKVTVVFKEKS